MLHRPSSVGIGPAIFVIERFSADGLLVYQTGQDEHKIDVPFNLLPESPSAFIALQRPSSVGIRPVKYLIERLSANGLLVYQLGTMSTKMRTGQFVDVEIKLAHSAAAPQLGWNSTCKIID